MIPTISGTEVIITEKIDPQTGRRIVTLISVKDYNKNKWLIDKSDMQMPFCKSLRTSFKWYEKLFFHLLEISPFNV